MKISIGFRAKPDCVFYAIMQEKDSVSTIVSIDKIKIAKTLELPEQLKALRSVVLDIIRENDVTNCCIRLTETNARSTSIERISIEAILQELVASSSINRYKQVRIAQLASLLKIKGNELKPIIEGKKDYNEVIPDFSSYNKEQKEAILSALSALNL